MYICLIFEVKNGTSLEVLYVQLTEVLDLDHCLHHITDTHVCHHLFSKMPFYNAAEATEAFKSVLGEYYLKDNTPIARALYRSFSNCQFVEDEGNIVFYKAKK